MKEILLSMKPEWFFRVLSGEKIYEYRKHFPEGAVRAYVYVSSPVKAVCAIIDFEEKISLKKWREQYKHDENVLQRIDTYLAKNNFAIPIKKCTAIAPIRLEELRNNISRFVAPQMYYLLDKNITFADYLKENARKHKMKIVNDFSSVDITEICRNYRDMEANKLKQISLFDNINFTEENEIETGMVLNEENVDSIHPRLVSLFSGCGGMDLGFKQAGYSIVYANDFDSDAQRVYERNIGKIDKRSILDVSADEIPNCDILNAGFPCQPFSNAGNRKGVDDSRGNLYKECLRVIAEKMPKVVVFENVRGLLSTKDENNNLLIDTIVKNLDEIGIGYNVTYKLVNASNYGVPQNRIRVIVVAFRKDLNKKFVFPPEQSKEGLNIGNLLGIPEDVPNQVDWGFSPQAMSLIQHIPEGGSWKSIPYEYLPERFRKIRDNMKRYHAPNMYRRFARHEIAGTITAAAQPENCGIIHPFENRRFNIREIARIQTFPDTFTFFTDDKKSITGMYKVIGNAVPPILAEVVGKAIKQQLGEKLIKEDLR